MIEDESKTCIIELNQKLNYILRYIPFFSEKLPMIQKVSRLKKIVKKTSHILQKILLSTGIELHLFDNKFLAF